MLKTKRYLKALAEYSKQKLLSLLQSAELAEDEYLLVYYMFYKEKMRDNICDHMAIGRTKYASLLNSALIKIDIKLRHLSL